MSTTNGATSIEISVTENDEARPDDAVCSPESGCRSDADDPGEDVHRSRYDGDAVPPSFAVIELVADLSEADATELTPLGTVVDPDALDRLGRPSHRSAGVSDVSISFTYEGFDVTVYGDSTRYGDST